MKKILQDLYEGKIDPQKAEELLSNGYIDASGIGKFDFLRPHRCGIPEVVISEGKQYPHLLQIVKEVITSNDRVLISRLEEERKTCLIKDLEVEMEGFDEIFDIIEYPECRGLIIRGIDHKVPENKGIVGIITAGTSDIPVAREAEMILKESGVEVITAYDVGVAGLHRLTPVIEEMKARQVSCFIVCAGREGTLPSLVAGLVNSVVIGVPVSTGYGYGGNGQAALMSMLQSCAPLAVVNIDAGLVAGIIAVQISNKISSLPPCREDFSESREGESQ